MKFIPRLRSTLKGKKVSRVADSYRQKEIPLAKDFVIKGNKQYKQVKKVTKMFSLAKMAEKHDGLFKYLNIHPKANQGIPARIEHMVLVQLSEFCYFCKLPK